MVANERYGIKGSSPADGSYRASVYEAAEGGTISQFTKGTIAIIAGIALIEWYFTSSKFFQTNFLPIAFVMFLVGAWSDKQRHELGMHSDAKLGAVGLAVPLAWLTSYIW